MPIPAAASDALARLLGPRFSQAQADRDLHAQSETAHAALAKIGMTGADVDWCVPHQANIRIIEATAKRMQLPMEKVVLTVADHGNTSAASIPLALSVGKARGQIKPGDLVVTEAIGGGLAWGSVVLRW